jgi:uncharacterized protein
VNQNELKRKLEQVVESCVNSVGVDVNSASEALLAYVAGVNKSLAKNIIEYRNSNGPFASRAALVKVPLFGPKAFEQAAGFLRVRDGDTPLDASAIHPESYKVALAVLKRANLAQSTPPTERAPALDTLVVARPLPALAEELGTGEPTLRDILEQLVRPGRDPREDLPPPLLRRDVLSLDDLQTGMVLNGTVRNVVDFGAFIDIGLKDSGLVHISQMANRYVKSPYDVVAVGDVVNVWVIEVKAGEKKTWAWSFEETKSGTAPTEDQPTPSVE